MKTAWMVISLMGVTAAGAKNKAEQCPVLLNKEQIQSLQSLDEVTIDNITFQVDGDSRPMLNTLSQEDFSGAEPFVQKQGRTLSCWMKLKEDNKHFGLREK
jgi:hypothetical protein